MSEFGDQKQLWDAYGHAMGAATGVEMLMRIALLDVARRKHQDSAEKRAAEAAKISAMTFGHTAKAFIKEYPEFAADERFVDAISNARDVRNGFAHHFLANRMYGFHSEEGIRLIALECMETTTFFKSLDQHIRDHCRADFDGYFKLSEARAAEWLEKHPLRERLAAIEAGKIPEPLD